MDTQPHLSDAIVSLRPLQPEDWEILYGVAADPMIWAGHPEHDRWQATVFRRFFDQALASGGALIASDPSNGRVIGSSRYDRERVGADEIEIGWTFLARSHWGGRTNAAMKRLMVGHALRYFGRVIFFVAQHNLRSQRAVEKIGGVLTDRRHEIQKADVSVHYVIYALDRQSFIDGPLGTAVVV